MCRLGLRSGCVCYQRQVSDFSFAISPGILEETVVSAHLRRSGCTEIQTREMVQPVWQGVILEK